MSPALEDGHRQPQPRLRRGRDLRGGAAADRAQRAQVVLVGAAGGHRQGRQTACAGDLDVEPGRVGALGCGDQVGIVLERHVDRGLRVGRQSRQRWRGLEAIGRIADQRDVVFARGQEIGARALEVAFGERQPALRLGDVGAGEVADLEAVARRLQIGAQDVDIVGGQADERLVLDHVHVGGDHLREQRALGAAQIRPPGQHAGVGRADAVPDRPAREYRDGQIEVGAHLPIGRDEAARALLEVLGEVARGAHRRPTLRALDRGGLVGRAQRIAISLQRGIGLVGLHQRFLQRVGGGGGSNEGARKGERARQGSMDASASHGQNVQARGLAKAGSTGMPSSASGKSARSAPTRRPAASRVTPF